jgi:hypothetical protein
LHWRREDEAPHFAGLPPVTTQAQLNELSGGRIEFTIRRLPSAD